MPTLAEFGLQGPRSGRLVRGVRSGEDAAGRGRPTCRLVCRSDANARGQGEASCAGHSTRSARAARSLVLTFANNMSDTAALFATLTSRRSEPVPAQDFLTTRICTPTRPPRLMSAGWVGPKYTGRRRATDSFGCPRAGSAAVCRVSRATDCRRASTRKSSLPEPPWAGSPYGSWSRRRVLVGIQHVDEILRADTGIRVRCHVIKLSRSCIAAKNSWRFLHFSLAIWPRAQAEKCAQHDENDRAASIGCASATLAKGNSGSYRGMERKSA